MIKWKRFTNELRKSFIVLLAAILLSPNVSFLSGDGSKGVAFADAATVITNGGFELGSLEGWSKFDFTGTADIASDQTVSRNGAHAMRIHADQQYRGTVHQKFPIGMQEQGKPAVLQQWVRTDNFTGDAYFRFQFYSGNTALGTAIYSNIVKSANHWTVLERQAQIPANATHIKWESFYENGTGTVWYDDSSLVIVADEAGPNNSILANGSFERVTGAKADNWESYTFSGSPAYVVDQSEARTGYRSYQISASDNSRGAMIQRGQFTAEQKNKTYTLQQWVKTADFAAESYLRIQIYTDSNERISYLESSRISTTTDWTKLEINVPVADNAHRYVLESFLENGTGTLWLDDVTMTEIVAPAELLLNGGFEGTGAIAPWGTYTFQGTPLYELDNTTYRNGNQSLRISTNEYGRGAFNQNIAISAAQAGKTYRLRQWVKTADFTGEAYFRVVIVDQNNQRIGYIESSRLKQTDDWTLLELMVNLAPEARRVTWESFFENGTGTVWFDDSSFVPFIPLAGLQLEAETLNLNPGGSGTMVVRPLPENATEQDVAWTTSSPAIATVDNGVVTAHQDGVAVITATAGNGAIRISGLVIVGQLANISVEDTSATVTAGQQTSGAITAQSGIGGPLAYEKLAVPDSGIARVDVNGNWTYYAPEQGASADKFYVLIRDASGGLQVAKVAITILPRALPPKLEDVIQPTDFNKPVSGKMTVLQANGTLLSYELEKPPVSGSAVMDPATGAWQYTPNVNFTGSDSFGVQVTNEHGLSASALVQVYTAPTADAIIAELKTRHPNNNHPRLLATENDFERIRTLLASGDDRVASWLDRIKSEAEQYMQVPPKPYAKPDGLRLDTTSSERISTLAFLYQITGEDRYLERAWEELEYVSGPAYPDWSPGHFLDTATMTNGIALGYDWLYHGLTPDQRATVREAIKVKGLSPAVPMYLDKTYWWVYNRNNWNFIGNTGMSFGALAIAEEEEELSGLILREAFKSIQYGLPQYAPDGSAIEGPGYWEYGTVYLVQFLSALDTALGHDHGFSQAAGLKETPLYPIQIYGPQGTFNYSDNSSLPIPGRLLLWFADKFDEPSYTWYHNHTVDTGATVPGMYDLLWYRPEIYGNIKPTSFDNHFVVPQAVTMRSSWGDPNALFAGFKGGINGAPHGDLDTGSFVFDAYGVRWALDSGSENYNLPGYWDMGEHSQRWAYYRKRTEGHNTLVMNPRASRVAEQDVTAVSEIVRTAFERPEGAFAIADLTPAYKADAASVKRGTALLNHRRQFLVQDEIAFKQQSELYWFMHTSAKIEIGTGGKDALLSQNGRLLHVQLLEPAHASFTEMQAEPLPSSPNPAGQTPNRGIKKLVIHLENELDTTIRVLMTPLMADDLLNTSIPDYVPLNNWSIAEGPPAARPSALHIGGELLAQFDPLRHVYEVALPSGTAVPSVSASAPGFNATVQQATGIPGVARIDVSDPGHVKSASRYYIQFSYEEAPLEQEHRLRYIPVAVSASAHDGNVPENTLDGNMATRWSAEGQGQWIQYDLGDKRELELLQIGFYQGHVRTTYFNIELSENGTDWTTVYEGFSSGTTSELQRFPFTATNARHVRIVAFGNSANQWNSINEVEIYGLKLEETDTEEPGAGGPGTSESGGEQGREEEETEDQTDTEIENEDGTEAGGVTEGGAPFRDIAGHWAFDAIARASKAGIVQGYPDGTFRPEHTVTREQFLLMVINKLRGEGKLAALSGSGNPQSFKDENEIAPWAEEAVRIALHNGIITGFADYTFRPSAPITRLEMVVIAARAFSAEPKPDSLETGLPYTDINLLPGWATEYVAAAHQAGWIKGKGNGQFDFHAFLKRSEAVTVLMNIPSDF
ncbi:S-layer homology domain-containing protein [Paenibacillus sp. PAMC21692]|uniref:S-layer homology domain-containing protein n=1 Tax=Paenibacillus sp. PAMC21692 TaxID=2762320 RepID=UPI00164D50C2|nr:S-layer homology domain-containing protein [Paenibacillus sp. PAMC21692]QNK58643.1 S-layer homology domain-containing protein [Paenibacillus sp. PAMC21692]